MLMHYSWAVSSTFSGTKPNNLYLRKTLYKVSIQKYGPKRHRKDVQNALRFIKQNVWGTWKLLLRVNDQIYFDLNACYQSTLINVSIYSIKIYYRLFDMDSDLEIEM